MANRQPDLHEIFNDARERETDEERSRYLDEACRDAPETRARIEALLRADSDPRSLLAAVSPDIAATRDLSPLEQPGTQIGPYKLLEQIGEGGMGIVYVASQREPLRRKVALKIIKPGMDTREVVARFEAERQALAMMDHPNIAKVFDAGATEAGRPYFAMELVKGTPITEYCDREQLSMRERLALFVTLCHGVQHAHQKGVIHRDLKPSNLLVEVHDVRPVPKIIDFGIAKAMGQHLTEKTFYTAQSQMVGTPLYMSPEQAGQSAVDVDTRSDIYSLGVLLYELLTGHTPFEKDTLRTAGFDEMRRIIREVEPPRPSARVSTLQAADLSTISECRHIEPRKLSQELRGDLDWIVMKAMDKDRDRRYATVNDLATDVERYLHDEPVQACPPSVAHRFTKFARRNQAALVTGALVALALIAGTGISIWQAIRATNAEVAAITERDEKEQQALRATRAERQTAQALLTAQERLQFGRQAVEDMYTQFAEKWLAQQAELSQVQRQFLEKALAFYQQLATEQSDDPTIQFETAKAHQRAGEIQRKLGQHKESEASFRQARGLLQQLVREKPDEPQYRDWLAQTQGNLGGLLFLMGRLPEAEQDTRSALEIGQALVAQFPGEAEYQVNLPRRYYNLGRLLGDTGRAHEAEAAYRQSVTLLESLVANSPDDPEPRSRLAVSQDGLANVIGADKPEEAETLFRAAIHATTSLLVADPKNTDYRAGLATSHNNLGLLLRQLGRPLEAETSIGQALSMFQGLSAELPDVPHYRSQVAINFGNLAIIAQESEKHDQAIALAIQTLEVVDKLATDYPDIPKYSSDAFQTRMLLASSQIMSGKLEEARVLLEPTIAQRQSALKSNPDKTEYHVDLAVALNYFGLVMGRMNRLDEAEIAFRSAVEHAERVIAQPQWATKLPGELLRPFLSLADLLVFREKLPEAEVACRRTLELSNSLLNHAPNAPRLRMKLAEASDHLGMLYHGAKQLPEAEQAGRRAIEIQNTLSANRPDDIEVRTLTGACLSNLAATLLDAGQFAEARQLLEQAIVHQQAALKLDPAHTQSQDFLNIHRDLLLEALVLLGDDEAVAKEVLEQVQGILSGGDGIMPTVALVREACIEHVAQSQHAAVQLPQRLESHAKAHFLVAKALIREAIQRSPDDPDLYVIADLLTTAPEPLRDPDLALRLAQRAVELKPGDGIRQQSLGWALYRTGDLPGAIEALQKTSTGGENDFVRAMIHWQLGEKTEARASFDGASEQLKSFEPGYEENLKRGMLIFPMPVQLKRLQAEAATMLGVPLPTVEPAPEPAAKVEETPELPKSTPAPEAAKAEETPQ